ncbi:Exocyst complex component S15B [Salvia divinorum]|uniref:Exocyst complex component n=1 Tax=Salvia divinorum TaxID=28513 RepID=A0ABD1GPI3_SALDI
MNTITSRRNAVPAAENGDISDKQDQLLLSAAICNGEDLASFVRKVFASGKPETLLLHLKRFSKSKESEIEDVCRAHYQDFITAVDDLRSLLSDVDSLKSSLSNSNSQLQNVAAPLLTSLDSYVEARNKCGNITLAINSLNTCVRLMELCSRANFHLAENNFYLALRCLDSIETDFQDQVPSTTLKRMLEKQIPSIRAHIERQVNKEFGDWLVEIRTVSRNLGQLAIGQASAGRQREEELRLKQRQAEEQSRLSLRDCVYALEEEDSDEIDGVVDGENGGNGILGFDLTPLYKGYHIHQTLGLGDRFRQYYFENSGGSGFEDGRRADKENGSGEFMGYCCDEDVFCVRGSVSRMQTANHLLLIKDYVSLLGVTLRRFGYPIDALLDVISKHRDKYHELLLSDCRKQMAEALAADKFEQMYMKKEYEYSMNVLSFQIQTSDIMPAFPYVAPFSSTVHDCCRIVRSFIEDSVSFMSHGGQLEFYDVVKKYLDRLLTEVLDGALLKVINNSIGGVTQAMQMAANMAVFERACDFFFRHAAQLSGIPLRIAERGKMQFPLIKARGAAEETLSGLLKQKVDGFLTLMENVNWVADEPPQGGNEYANEVIIFLETLISTAQQILPVQVLKRIMKDVLSHISEMIIGALLGESVKRFNVNAIMGLDVDVRLLESFAENQSNLLSETDASQLKSALIESRQMVNLLLSNHPENFLNPVIRERSYSALDYRKVVTISEKLRDQSDRLFGSFGTRGAKQNPKKKSLDTLIKRLKDAN